MGIDWFTVGAQAVNFVVLVVILKLVLYDRIVGAIEQRQREIAERNEDAERARDEAREEREEHQRQRREFEERRDELLEEARRDVDERRRELLDEAREEVDTRRQEWTEALQDARHELIVDMRHRAARGVGVAARRTLGDLADADLEERMVQAFLDSLQAAGDEAFEDVRGADGAVTVRTSGELPSGKRSHVTRVLREVLGDRDVGFETDPAVVCGIEAEVGGRVVSWSVRSYLDGLEDEIVARLDEQRDTGAVEDAEDADAGATDAGPDGDSEADSEPRDEVAHGS